MMRRLVVLAVAASLLGLLFVGATIYSLPDMTHAPGGSAAKTLATSGTMMFDEGPFPRWPYVLGMIALAPFLAGLVLAAPMAIARAPLSKRQRIVISGLMLPLASILLYRTRFRSEETRVGKECVRRCRDRGSPDH